MLRPPTERPLRLFFALWPPATVAAGLHRVARGIQARSGGRAMARDTLHQTLAFLGDTPVDRLPVLQDLACRLADCPPCTLTLDRLGYWRHNQIVWAAPSAPPAPLAQLVECLGEALGQAGFPVDRRPFAPHLTLLRKVRQPPELPELPPVDWPLEDFVLVASDLGPAGASYRVLGRWPILGTEAG